VLSLPDLDERARALGRYGDVALHVRSAALPVTARLDLARRFRAAARCVLINDRADLVPSAGADGVHLPARGIPVPTARDLLGPAAVVGRSGVPGLGLAALAEAQPARVVAIGGLTPERAAACLAAGAWGVAAVSALWLADDPAAAAEAFLLSLGLQP
jgi:thiamine-phosphate pyrophosphorylase